MKTGKQLKRCFAITAAAAVLFICWIFFGFCVDKVRPESSALILESEESAVIGDDRMTCAELSEDFLTGQHILFKSTHTKVEVSVGDEVVYRYGWETDAPSFLKSPGTMWHIVEVPAGSGGSTISIRQQAVYEDYFGDTLTIYYGSKGECVLELICRSLLLLIINCIIIFAGVICFLMHFITRKRSNEEVESFLCVGCLAFLIAVWSLCQSGLLQFVIPDGRALYFVDLFSFFLFPVPFNLFAYNLCKTGYRKGFAAISALYLVNMAADTAVQLAGLRDIFELISVTHFLMAVNVVYMFVAIYRESCVGNVRAKRFQLPLYIVALFAAAELVGYYINHLKKTSVFLPVGTIVFISMLIWIQVNQYYQSLLEEEKLLYFKKLASVDMLTEAFNRNAYENVLKDFGAFRSAVMFDVNDMKYINDNFGHERGDDALRLCYRCIREVFGTVGKCYRIGGDEFILLSDREYDQERMVKQFEQLVEMKKDTMDCPFSVAVGFAEFDPQKDADFKDTVRRSDEMMYHDKKRKKKY